ncbi:acyl-CoA synthetase [Aspergillus campestris IBT 28561]|uniref:Acyl-CoA synthetase n=1 Tax=Aspergillus campestris (strain IBT 28561) TaxID=1392248 RepID=A0A2I1DH38_ASPC2|nr:acyl-CoA synthetase [Aspergillus campestris IBT 28561]PKY09192.1 acyl-CoA synthetase [Aspergillus campestris IBT 28561]
MANQREHYIPKMHKKPPFSFEVSDVEKISGETLPRRNIRCKDGLINQPDPSVRTIYDVVTYGAKKFGNARCIGTRKVLKVHKETKVVKKVVDGAERDVPKEWSYFELSPYSFLSFVEFQAHVSTLGAGLKKMGMEQGDKIHLYGATSMNWFSMAHGAFTRSCAIVTAYDTLGLEGLQWSLKQTKSKAIFLDASLLSTLNDALSEAPAIQYVILNNESEPSQPELDRLQRQFPHVQVFQFDEIKQLGEENPAEHVLPEPEDLACVMYTSGTSGPPKGVTIKHKAVVAAIAGATSIVGPHIGPGDGLLTYLPQAHIIEFLFENAALFWGATMGYGSPRTLTKASVRNCEGDIMEFRPSVLVGVPAVWETIRKGIVNQVNGGSFLTRNLFWGALSLKQFLVGKNLPGIRLLDSLVFDKVRAATGGRLRLTMSGGGPLAKDTQRFISMAVCPVINGYGLTETCAMGALCDPLALTFDAHGDIPTSIEQKLVDFPEAGYFTTNDPPQGELLIRGDPVTTAYYDNEEETKLAIREGGWFMTGDIAEFDKNGHVRIIDRKKNLVKTLNGEYIALEKLESIYRASPLVANICVFAAADQSRPIAIIVPAEPALMRLAKDNDIPGKGMEDVIDNPKIRSLVLAELQKAGRQGRLAAFEIIEGVVLDRDEWTPQNGMVTAAQKVQRKKIFQKNEKAVEKAYKKGQ